MNMKSIVKNRFSASLFAVVTIVSLVLSAFPASFYISYAANIDAVGTVAVFIAASPAPGNSEYVSISFTGTGTLNLDGWTLHDNIGLRHTIGSGVSLVSTETFVVCGDSSLPVVCDEEIDNGGNAVWNNSGDTMTLRDDNGDIVHTVTWTSTTEGELQGVGEGSLVDYSTPTACTPQFNVTGPTDIQNITTGEYFDTVNDALEDCDTAHGDTIELLGNITTSEQISIEQPVTLDGNGYTVDATFAKTDNSNNSAIGIIGTEDVVLKDLILDGSNGTDLHGINVYVSTNIAVENVESKNFRSGMVVNGSEVDASDFSTAGNIWHGINVAPGSGVTDPSILNISNTSSHDEVFPPLPHIYTDNINAGPIIEVNDLDDQYEYIDIPAPSLSIAASVPTNGPVARAYYLAEPEVEPEALDVCSVEGTVVSYTEPAFKNNGNPVDANRRDVAALESLSAGANFFGGESNWSVSDFFSLGIQGELVYEFTTKVATDQPGADIAIWETTGGGPNAAVEEKVEVWVSDNGVDFVYLETVTGDASVDIAPAALSYVKFVKLVDSSVGVQGGNGDGFDVDAITIINNSCIDEPEPITTFEVVASKIVCSDESELPDWAVDGPDITSTTATDWVAENASCELVSDWQFQWAPYWNYDGGDTFVNQLGGPWQVFGPTDVTGSASIELEIDEVGQDGSIWMREVLQNGYLPFTYQSDETNSSTESAEFYCHTDVSNYDNLDQITDIEAGETYYCVAWNTLELQPLTETPSCDAFFNEGIVVEQDGVLFSFDEGGAYIGPEAVDVPPGYYDINAVSYDNHGGNTWDVSTLETWFINGLLNSEVVFTSLHTPDLPSNLNVEEYQLDRGVYLENGLDAVEWVHGAFPDSEYNSIHPVCLQFLPVEPPVAPYCGDGEVNQEWEQCEIGDENCTDHCLFANQCSAEQLIKITLDQNAPASESFDGSLHLGATGATIPNGTWFNFNEIGDVPVHTNANGDMEGLAIERTANELRLAVKGDNARTKFDYVFGTIETLGVELGLIDRHTVVGWPLENSGDYVDVFAKNSGESIDFNFYLTTGHDSVAVEINEGEEFNCPLIEETSSNLSGYVYEVVDEINSPLVNWTVYAYNAATSVTLATTTNGAGFYSFGVAPGDWEVYDNIPTGWQQQSVYQDGLLVVSESPKPLSCYFVSSEGDSNSCDFYNMVVEEAIVTSSGGAGSSSGTRTSLNLNQPAPTPLVAGASTDMCPFILDYMQIGWNNSTWEVTKLQMFLSIVMGYENPITGVFDLMTDANVKLFQERYRSEVLDPWFEKGIVPHNQPTGFVYKTTRWKINDIVCPGTDPYPSFEGEDLRSNVDSD